MPQPFDDAAAAYSRLFLYFAAFEAALKEAGYLFRQPMPKVNWAGFAGAVGDDFFRSLERSPVVRRLIAEPPKKFRAERVSEDRWEVRPEAEPASITSTAALLDAVKTARNNLLHGDKFTENPSRDVEITEAGVFVLRTLAQWVQRKPELRAIGGTVGDIERSFPLALGQHVRRDT